jgi:hypothetical protein
MSLPPDPNPRMKLLRILPAILSLIAVPVFAQGDATPPSHITTSEIGAHLR